MPDRSPQHTDQPLASATRPTAARNEEPASSGRGTGFAGPQTAPPWGGDAQRRGGNVCDLLVIGSGAGGLSAAVTAAHLGLKVIVAEKDPQVGGTTAWSGGWMWVPRNPLAVEAGINEPIEEPLAYLRHEQGERIHEARARAAARPRCASSTATPSPTSTAARHMRRSAAARSVPRRSTAAAWARASPT